MNSIEVLGHPIHVLGWSDSVERVLSWAAVGESRAVCICNSHSLVNASKDAAFAQVLRSSDMNTSDGAPVAFLMRRYGAERQVRISGPDLMLLCCESAAQAGVSVFLYGSRQETLDALVSALKGRFQSLKIAGSYSPPFRMLSEGEDAAIVDAINASGAGIVWVGLGCPKQEAWMIAHRGRIKAVMVGVGAAFDYHAGLIARAPHWMQQCGLEWLHRLLSEPRRLWRRYLVTNTLFIVFAIRELLSRAAR